MILELVDGGILNIIEDHYHYDGCETCDYGSSYINEITFELTTMNLNVEASQMYDYPLSDGEIMKIMLPNSFDIQKMTESEFVTWFKGKLSLRNHSIKFNVTKK